MTHRTNAEQRRYKKPKVETVQDDVSHWAPGNSACEVSKLKQELMAIMESDQLLTTSVAAYDAYNRSTNYKGETLRLQKEMEITIQSVEESEFYTYFVDQIDNNAIIQSNIKRILGADLHMDMVIYGLGSLQNSYTSQYQLALALLLKRKFSHWIGEIEVYDPLFTSIDRLTMEILGCNVLTVDEQCKRHVEKPTLFCLPYLVVDRISNLLEANGCAARLNRMVILACSFNGIAARKEAARHVKFLNRSYDFIHTISKYAIEVNLDIPEAYSRMFSWCTWHFFSLDAGFNLEPLVPSDTRLKEVSLNDLRHSHRVCRGIITGVPLKRWLWWPPPTGWVKLNFCGTGHGEDTLAGFGGVFCDEQRNRLAVYCGNLGKADPEVASIEALRWGLEYLEMVSPVRQVVIEGDHLQVVRWVNGVPEPPSRIADPLSKVQELLKGLKTVVDHVYEEANSAAVELAKKGASLKHCGVCLCTQKEVIFERF